MLVATLSLLAQVSAPEAATFLLRDITVVDTDAGRLVPHQDVLVRGDRIASVTQTAGEPAPGVRVIEGGAGRFLMPGLVDAHVHVDERDLPLFLANGVTAIRELNGSDAHLDMRARIESGKLIGPRMKVVGPLLAGEVQRWRHELVEDPESATQLANRLADDGYDALKIYDGLTPDVYAALRAVATERSLPLVGHVPQAVGFDAVLAAGQHLEHTEQIVRATAGHELDREWIPRIVAAIERAGVVVTPTLASQRILSHTRTAEFADRFARPEIAYVDPNLMGWWESLRGPESAHPRQEFTPSPYFTFQADLVVALDAAGVPLLVGTDTPNPLLVPGFSMHDELGVLVAAGLSRARVLRASTILAAELLGWTDQGRIAAGQVADLVLLDGNPLESLEPLKHPAGVMAAGRWFDRDDLAAMIAPLARGFAPAWDGEVRVAGALRAMFHQGQTGAQVTLDEVLGGPDVYALGALADLAGEITVVGGKAYLSYPADAETTRTEKTTRSTAGAALLVSTKVPAWRAVTTERPISFEDLDDALAELAAEAGMDLDQRFPFLVEGHFEDLRFHVIDGSRLAAGGTSHEDHLAASVRTQLDRAAATLVGFYSKGDQGVFTHMGSRTHVHCVLDEPLATGHVDHVTIPAGTTIRFPATE